jgi:hypothetical protein
MTMPRTVKIVETFSDGDEPLRRTAPPKAKMLPETTSAAMKNPHLMDNWQRSAEGRSRRNRADNGILTRPVDQPPTH